MPTYEYACRACGHAFEEIHKMSDPPVDTCPSCGKKDVQRLISQGNFILKGGGWYTTGGYGSKGSKSDSEGGPPAETKTETKSDTKAESKSEAKSDTKSEAKTETKSEPKPAAKPD